MWFISTAAKHGLQKNFATLRIYVYVATTDVPFFVGVYYPKRLQFYVTLYMYMYISWSDQLNPFSDCKSGLWCFDYRHFLGIWGAPLGGHLSTSGAYIPIAWGRKGQRSMFQLLQGQSSWKNYAFLQLYIIVSLMRLKQYGWCFKKSVATIQFTGKCRLQRKWQFIAMIIMFF